MMGEHEEWAQPSRLLPNGLLPDETSSVIQFLDGERWSKAEERTEELLSCIKPNQPSDERRKAVVDYVERLIKKCFDCEVFTFGSVPLKTYLPDGDIDLSAFSKDHNLKDTWATKVRDILESEEKNENAEFRVKEVQYIQAEVKIIKCLVENIVVDISFNQLGGLCTLCFLEAVDHLTNHNYLFKRSIILIKAWCYYESRILGAHHGLISTYALETLVLYIFHVFNNMFAGPLEVLYRFLEFFSNFDWDNFCVSLWGPVPISSLPDVTAEPPRKDSGNLVLSKLLLEACSTFCVGENQGPPFVSKHFNVIDPLRVNNNLGRSVSKGNFFRIRSAFAFGAKSLRQLLDCPKEDILFEMDQFFMNTWERHGNCNRPDAPTSDLHQVRPSNPHCVQENDDPGNMLSSQIKNERSSGHEPIVEDSQSSNTCLTHCSSSPLESKFVTNDGSSVSHVQALKAHTKLNSSRLSGQSERGNSNQGSQVDKRQRNLKPWTMVNEQVQGKYPFGRAKSSPDLTDTYGDSSSHSRRNKVVETVKHQVAAVRTDNSRRKDITSETISSQRNRSSSDDLPSSRHIASHQQTDVAIDSDSTSSNYLYDSGIGSSMGKEHATIVGAQGMQQVEQDLVNMMSSSMNNFGGHVPMPLNLASTRSPLPFSPSMLASSVYAQRNLGGMVPGNIPLVEPPWGPNLQLPQGLISSPLTQYFPGIGLKSNMEDMIGQVNENYVSPEMAHGNAHNEFWDKRDEKSNGRFACNDGSLEILDTDDRQPSTSGSSSFDQSSQFGGSGSFSRAQQKFNRENRGSVRDEHVESIHHQDNRISEVYLDDGSGNIGFSSVSQDSLLSSKSSSGSSWDGSSEKASRSTRERRGRRATASSTSAAAVPSAVYGKGKSIFERHSSLEIDDESRDWNSNTTGPEMVERSTSTQPEAALHLFKNHLSGYEAAQTSGSDSLIPMSPMLLGPGSRSRVADNSGVLPFTFYPMGPPVPFLTMLPLCNFPSDGGNSDASISPLSREVGVDNTNLNQGLNSYDRLDDTGHLNMSSSVGGVLTAGDQLDEPKDILHSDFVSHWKNLQYGRICQNPRYHGPVVYPPSVVVPPIYLQGQFPWDGPARPPLGGANMNLFSQLMNYGPRILPVTPLQPVSNRTAGVYQRYVDDMPRYRSGTGTYLPNPKTSTRDRHSSGTRRSSYNFDRYDNHADREGNWNAAKSRSSGRSHHRNQADKSSSRLDHLSSSESRADRQWSSHRHESSLPSYYAQNGPLRPNSSQGASASVAYGMYPIPGMNPNGFSSNGPSVPSVVMLYPYDHNAGYVSHSEPFEFGSVGPVGYVSSNEGSPLAEGTQTRGLFEEQRSHGSSQRSSPDQPSSPHFQRHFIF